MPIARRFLSLHRRVKQVIVFALDGGLSVVCTWAAYYLMTGSLLPLQSPGFFWAVALSLSLMWPIFIVNGLYRAIFRHNGHYAMLLVVNALLIYTVCYFIVIGIINFTEVHVSIAILQPVLLFMAVVSSRILARILLIPDFFKLHKREKTVRVLVYGAGSAGRQLAAAMLRSDHHKLVGYVDDDARLWGHTLDGLTIYSPHQLERCIRRKNVTELLLALPSITRRRRAEIIEDLKQYQVHVRTLPSVSDIALGKVDLSDLRELEIEDLLVRDTVVPNAVLMHRHIRDKVVLVTGAGGSIGSELCRQILAYAPKKLLLLDLSEYALYAIHQELNKEGVEIIPLLGSVVDESRVKQIISTWRPHAIYHAAAYKHVPMVEFNPVQGILNNVWGTLVCARAARECLVPHFILVSTDKAVRPTNIMGASKRLAEMVLQSMAELVSHSSAKPKTMFAMVRFGNVLGSSGSVVPRFRRQIEEGGPVTVTHPEVTRYFMTIPEAAQLVIQSGAMAMGGDVYVLDMGKPIKILALARHMIELSGLSVKDEANPEGDIEIQITGLRPGEKLYEELLIGNNPEPTQHVRIMKAHEEFMAWNQLTLKLDELYAHLLNNDVPAIKQELQQLVKGYQPEDEVSDFVWQESNVRN